MDGGAPNGGFRRGGRQERRKVKEAGRAGGRLREEGERGDGVDEGPTEDEICGQVGPEET